MVNTLENKSSIVILKSKFFFFRIVGYFSFLFIPIWVPKILNLSLWQQTILGVLYAMFMMSQWFLLGKEIDHRFKIYAKVNSSLDRVVYRLFIGIFFLIIYFNFLTIFPAKWIYNLFWVTWAILGLFYSWPTRGKIIQESMTGQFAEFRFLDSFERTILFLTLLFFVISIPELPLFHSTSALKLYYDPHEFIHQQFWNFLDVNYFPFRKYPRLIQVSWWIHFYVVSLSLLLLLTYAISRYFVSRRLSLLTVLAFMSTWSITKLFIDFHGLAFFSLFPFLLLWGYLWSVRSSTYRSGLFWGLIGYLGVLLNPVNIIPILIAYLLFFSRYIKKTFWYKKQILRYMSAGFVLMMVAVVTTEHSLSFAPLLESWSNLSTVVKEVFNRKGFYIISILGAFILIVKYFFEDKFSMIKIFTLGKRRNEQLLFFVLLMFLMSFAVPVSFYALTLIMLLSLFSMIPVELLFQRISRLRSSRNMIYAIYILLCLLDSHIEGRVKIFLSIFK